MKSLVVVRWKDEEGRTFETPLPNAVKVNLYDCFTVERNFETGEVRPANCAAAFMVADLFLKEKPEEEYIGYSWMENVDEIQQRAPLIEPSKWCGMYGIGSIPEKEDGKDPS